MTEDALNLAMQETLGYPFFLQLFGRHLVEAMNAAGSGQADRAIAERAAQAFQMDQDDFYKGRRSGVPPPPAWPDGNRFRPGQTAEGGAGGPRPPAHGPPLTAMPPSPGSAP